MRKQFANILLNEMNKDKKFVLITADMGYGLWDQVRDTHPHRFFNVGSSEQLMIGISAGMGMEGKIPICYSITPFLLYRPFEFIRNLMNHEKIPIKIVGGGRDKDYGYLGFTHWAEEDLDIMRQLKNIKCYKPADVATLDIISSDFLHNPNPAYLNLSK